MALDKFQSEISTINTDLNQGLIANWKREIVVNKSYRLYHAVWVKERWVSQLDTSSVDKLACSLRRLLKNTDFKVYYYVGTTFNGIVCQGMVSTIFKDMDNKGLKGWVVKCEQFAQKDFEIMFDKEAQIIEILKRREAYKSLEGWGENQWTLVNTKSAGKQFSKDHHLKWRTEIFLPHLEKVAADPEKYPIFSLLDDQYDGALDDEIPREFQELWFGMMELRDDPSHFYLPHALRWENGSVQSALGHNVNKMDARARGLKCVGCGRQAKGYRFGVLACHTCSESFRISRLEKLVCRKDNNCIEKCKACRAARCVAAGMNSENKSQGSHFLY